MEVKIARRYQVTIPQEVREKMDLSVGDVVEVRYDEGKIIIEKVLERWEDVMVETTGAWRNHPVFGKMKNSIEVVDWLRGKK